MMQQVASVLMAATLVAVMGCDGARTPEPLESSQLDPSPQVSEQRTSETPSGTEIFEPADSYTFPKTPAGLATRTERAARDRMGDRLIAFEQRYVARDGERIGVVQVLYTSTDELSDVEGQKSVLRLSAQAFGLPAQIRSVGVGKTTAYAVSGGRATILQAVVGKAAIVFIGRSDAATDVARLFVRRLDQ